MKIGDKVLITKSYWNANTQEREFYKEYEGTLIAETENQWKVKRNFLFSEWIPKSGTFDRIKKITF
jgi:hypothetical protein